METINNNSFTTSVLSLSDLSEYNFTIPTYQRPFVWGDEQLKKLLDDFYKSFKNDPDSIYYISTFLTKEQGFVAELIDGQQRFTSLWLISFAIGKICPESKIVAFLCKNEALRLGFEIRQEVSDFLYDLLKIDNTARKIYDDVFIESYPYLRNIAKALVFINSYVEQLPKDELIRFGDFIYQKVHLIKNTTPRNTDLNKLFSTINSAGVQLEQTDIVKANLLKLIDEKVKYGKIWEACENMNNFFERNARISFPASNWHEIDLQKLIPFDEQIFKHENCELDNGSKTNRFNIDDIDLESIGQYNPPQKQFLNEKERDSEEIFCRSIINFGQLLIHTYRIHLKIEEREDFEGTFHVNRLIAIFKSLEERNDINEIKRFFHLLWKIRYLFDKYIIKWVSDIDSKSESLELVNFNKNEKSYYSRTKYAKSPSLMLQSVLYFSGDYLRQYWLTTYLGYLLENHNESPATDGMFLKYLESIDNTFSLNNLISDKELSRMLLNTDIIIENNVDLKSYLESNKGTGFKHYWFQKLEYVLWKNWGLEITEEYKNYRITSKNSVEHIYPQQPENSLHHPKIDDKYLHSFGNLVLLSVSQNSEYSNKSVSVKRSMFLEKNESYDTLKSYFIFEYKQWTQNEIIDHKEKMIKEIINHYNNV